MLARGASVTPRGSDGSDEASDDDGDMPSDSDDDGGEPEGLWSKHHVTSLHDEGQSLLNRLEEAVGCLRNLAFENLANSEQLVEHWTPCANDARVYRKEHTSSISPVLLVLFLLLAFLAPAEAIWGPFMASFAPDRSV